MDGVEVIRAIRAWSPMPIFVLSARSEGAQKIAALDAGADDFVTKPFGVGELGARLRVALRHAGGSAQLQGQPLKLGEIEVDLERRIVSAPGR